MAKKTGFRLGLREMRLMVMAGLAVVVLLYQAMGWQMPEPLRELVSGSAARYRQLETSVESRDLQPYEGKVVGVHDGDTLTVLEARDRNVLVKHKIRMADIDAPELKQPYGQSAKAALSRMAFGKTVRVLPRENDRYGRTVAVVEIAGPAGGERVNVNQSLVAGGHVWVYRDYLKDRRLLDLETQAKSQMLGLWALQADQRQAPWLYRKNERAAQKS